MVEVPLYGGVEACARALPAQIRKRDSTLPLRVFPKGASRMRLVEGFPCLTHIIGFISTINMSRQATSSQGLFLAVPRQGCPCNFLLPEHPTGTAFP